MDEDEYARKFGEAVRILRKDIGLSQEELADRYSLHRTSVGSVERGERNVSLENIVKIATTLNILGSSLLAKAGL